ncbi:MAG TPA: metallophosphoesterase, partial [Cyclobacteriaceae bacterium]
MSRKKKIIILGCSLLALYYLIGFPLTLFGVVNKWHLFPGGITLQFAGNKTHPYENEIVIPDSDGPYILYRNDSIYVTTIRVRDSVQIPETQAYPESERSNITIACTFAKNPEWNFKTTLKESLLNEHTYFSGVKKIVAISDIEGNFERFRELLLISGVIDSAYNWAFDDGHLVLAGDFFDRGLNVTECLWLIYNLETKAAQAGGYVHFILGNHEIMNMSYDFRYVRKKY